MVDILAFGAHPDDVEIGMGATVAKSTARGLSVGIIDLTRGEMGSNGSPDERLAESRLAGEILGLSFRENLALPDRGLIGDENQMRAVVDAIRRLRPRVVAMPYWEDRHPDHVAASRLIKEAVFSAALRRYETAQEPHRVTKTVYYFINGDREPSFVIDVSDWYGKKEEALRAHASQFSRSAGNVPTPLNDFRFPHLIRSRDAYLGAKSGCLYAEGFVVKTPVVVPDLVDWGESA